MFKKAGLITVPMITLVIGLLIGYQNCGQQGLTAKSDSRIDSSSDSTVSILNSKVSAKASSANIGRVRYFGYYASAMDQAGKGDYTLEISDHANLTWIARGNQIITKLKEAQNHNMKAVLDVQETFFDSGLNLRSDFLKSWRSLASKIAPYANTIAAFYPLDEPYLNGKNKGISTEVMKSRLETIASLLKSTYPQIPIAVIFSVEEVKNSSPFPQGYDWFAFDLYGDGTTSSYMTYFSKLKSRISGSQRLFIVPWAFKEGSAPSPQDINARIGAANYYWTSIAIADPSVVAVVPFLYQTFTTSTGDRFFGTQDMPGLRQTFANMGRSIVAANHDGENITRDRVTSVDNKVIGVVDNVTSHGTNSWTVNGWACAQGINKSISVDLYVGGAAGGGGLGISRTAANKSSEDAVAEACRAAGTMYRFQIPIPVDLAKKYSGKAIYVHGISPVGGANNVLAGSGKFKIPVVASSPSTTPPPVVKPPIAKPPVAKPPVQPPAIRRPTIINSPFRKGDEKCFGIKNRINNRILCN